MLSSTGAQWGGAGGRTADCWLSPQTEGGCTTPLAAAGSRFQKLAVSVNALPPTVSDVAFIQVGGSASAAGLHGGRHWGQEADA